MMNKNSTRDSDILKARALTILLPLLLSANKQYKPKPRLNKMHKIKKQNMTFNMTNKCVTNICLY
jgi:hypothetical protein